MMAEMEVNLKRRGERTLFWSTDARENRNLIGKRLNQIAKEMNRPPIETGAGIDQAGKRRRRVIQYDRKRYRPLHETEIYDDLFRKARPGIRASTAPPAQTPRVCLHRKTHQSAVYGAQHSSALTSETFRIPARV
jgi:hypothetical protein